MTRFPADTDAVPAALQARLDAAGLRRTLATRAALGAFLARPGQGLTHAQVLQALRQRGHEPNRVTLYRLLDRLAACAVLARHSDDRGIWRYRLQDPAAPATSRGAPALRPRFECRRCGQDRTLDDTPAARAWLRGLQRALARQGEVVERAELALLGVCARCADPDTLSQPRS